MTVPIPDAYLAGLFDGEGTVIITAPTPSAPRRHRLQVRICMTHEPTIRAVHAVVGAGTVRRVEARRWRAGAKDRWDWCVTGPTAGDFLLRVSPWLKTKAAAAYIAFEFLALHNTRGVKVSDDLFARREACRERLRAVNA